MDRYKFQKRPHPEGIGDGWLLRGAPSTYQPATAGMQVAHDLLEHVSDDDGSLKSELLALGTMLHVRGEGGYWAQYGHPQSNPDPGFQLSGDVVSLWMGAEEWRGASELGLPDPGDVEPVNEWVEEMIATACRLGREELVDEVEADPEDVDRYLDRLRGWLRAGYHAARERYEGCCPDELVWAFKQIEEEADRLLPLAEAWQVLVVEIDRCEANVYLDDEFDDDEDE